MNFPADLRYTKDHEWLRIEGDTGTIGITDYAQGELGDVIYIDIAAGQTLSAGSSFGTVEAVKTVSDLYSPVAGTITEVNTGLNDNPETVNRDPYGGGWLVKVKLDNPSDFGDTISVDEYKSLIGQ